VCPPVNPCLEIDGHGTLATNPKARFEIDEVRSGPSTQKIEGSIGYRDRDARLRFESRSISGIAKAGDAATIKGLGRANGMDVTFVVTASDASPDRFSIQLSNGYSAAGPLQKGTIRIREQCEDNADNDDGDNNDGDHGNGDHGNHDNHSHGNLDNHGNQGNHHDRRR
jgi:hypothetical protein